MNELQFENISVDPFQFPERKKNNIKISVLRLDKLHPVISGNKWFKLRFYLEEAKQKRRQSIVTFGGAWSNHIVATAAACKAENLLCSGIIRGEKPAKLSSTLLKAAALGMKLHFISRKDFKEKKIPPEFLNDEHYLIPEGGYGELGVSGASTMLSYCNLDSFTHICCAVGTGTMMAGIINAVPEKCFVTGISVLKNNNEIEAEINQLLISPKKNFTIKHNYHFGGYAKYKPGLISFMNSYYSLSNIPSDFVYTGKLFYAVQDLLSNNYFPQKSNILIIHSGGLQGNDSLKKGTLIF